MARRRDTSTPIAVAAAILVSLAVHLVLWPLGDEVVQWQWGSRPLPRSDRVIEVSLLPADGEQEPPTEAEQREELEELLEDDSKLVQLDELEREQPPPEDTPYISEFDNRVDEQTRAPKQRPQPGGAQNPVGDRPDAQQSEQDAARPSQDPADKKLPLQGRSFADQGEGQDRDPDQSPAAPDGRLPTDPGRSGGAPSPRGLAGVPDSLRKQWGRPGSYDDIDEGIDEGDANRLNARRFKYASFFNRVRDAVAEHWHPEVLHAARDPDGRVHGQQTRVTKLMISLNEDGSLHRARMVDSSGVDYLDEEAIRAVRAAQPFTNPPPQLVDSRSGKIEFGFAFIFEINGGRRIFRYRR